MKFYLGTHETSWLRLTDVPLFISRRRLALRKRSPRALGTWALDSGGFTELSMFGKWTTSAEQYISEVRRWKDEIGGMDWAACQDWMCEPVILARTGLTVAEHQRRTIQNYLDLKSQAPEIPWAPALQGWLPGDYLDHAEAYERAGVSLAAQPIVGLGSVCRRQALFRITHLIQDLTDAGIRLHGFGFKLSGLSRVGHLLESADSLAWSLDARRAAPMPGHPHKNCANCLPWALDWRERVLDRIRSAEQAAEQRLIA